MYIDERLLKILDTHKGETIDVNFMISLINTIAKEHETEQLLIGSVSKRFNYWSYIGWFGIGYITGDFIVWLCNVC
jgi:hypothetical protein